MKLPVIDARDVEGRLTWTLIADALEAGHRLPRAELGDLSLQRGEDTLLNRAAWIDGHGMALKSVTIFPRNSDESPSLPTIHGLVLLFDNETGVVKAIFDGALITRWKTAGDSVLGARFLARPDSKRLTILGSGVVAQSLIESYLELFPGLERVSVWSRSVENAQALVDKTACTCSIKVAEDVAHAVSSADIVATATLAQEPILRGDWIEPGTHVDLIGGFRPDMREADDEVMRRAEIFVDAKETTVSKTGDLIVPIEHGVIKEGDIRGDLYDLCQGGSGRTTDEAVTVFKNGGGAHLDLIVANCIYDLVASTP